MVQQRSLGNTGQDPLSDNQFSTAVQKTSIQKWS